MTEDEASDGAGEEAGGEGSERDERSDGGIEVGEEQFIEDEGGGRAIAKKVECFDGRAHHGRESDSGQHALSGIVRRGHTVGDGGRDHCRGSPARCFTK